MQATDEAHNFLEPAETTGWRGRVPGCSTERRFAHQAMWAAALASLAVVMPGCFMASSRQMPGVGDGSASSPSSMLQEESQLRPATEPTMRTGSGLAEGLYALGPSAEDEARLRACVDDAFDAIMEGDPSHAVDQLTEAQTIRGWAQSQYAASVFYWLGQAHERLDERTAAISAYRKVLTLYPNSPWSKRARKRLTALETGVS